MVGSICSRWPGLQKRWDATDVIVMMMCNQDRLELQIKTLKCLYYRRGIPGVYHSGLPAIMQQPDIVIPEGRDRQDF